MDYNIERNGSAFTTVRPTGKVYHRIMAEERVEMTFSLNHLTEFKINDSVVVLGKRYSLREPAIVTQLSTREWVYNLNFTSIKYELSSVSMFFHDQANALTEPDFSLMGTAKDMIDLVVANANREGEGWTRGTVGNTGHKLISFNAANALEALTMIADLFGGEFWVNEDKSINLTKYQPYNGVELEYGQDKGIRELVRRDVDESNLVTRLIARGSNKNLPIGYRNGSKYLQTNPVFLEENVNHYGIREEVKYFDDIFPMRIGTVTGVDANNPKKFVDSSLDFDLNAIDGNGNTTILIPGLSAKVRFQTGQLAGYQIEIHAFHSATKTFTLLQNESETAWEIPSDQVRPAVGDKYILEDIQMPASYVANAEAKLKLAAEAYLKENSKPRYVYKPNCDPLFFRRRSLRIEAGEQIRLISPEFGINNRMRVVALTTDLQDTYDQQPELSEVLVLRGIGKIILQKKLQEETRQSIGLLTAVSQNAQSTARTVMSYFDDDGQLKPEHIGEEALEAISANVIADNKVSNKTTWSSETLEDWALNDYANRFRIKTPPIGELNLDE